MIKYILPVLLLGLLFSCKEDGFQEYDSGDTYLYFEKSMEEDSIRMSFFFYNDDVVELKIPVQLSGIMFSENAKYKVTVDTASNAKPENYRLPEFQVFRPGMTMDTLHVQIVNSEELLQKEYKLVLSITSGDGYKQGPALYQKKNIFFSAIVTQPNWWDYTIKTYYLGEYSKKKYERFKDVTGVYDLTGMSTDKIWFNSILLKRELEKNPVQEEDGSWMSVPVNG